jgi:hypothetical protein
MGIWNFCGNFGRFSPFWLVVHTNKNLAILDWRLAGVVIDSASRTEDRGFESLPGQKV